MAVVSNNADYDFGDQISFFDVLQRVYALRRLPSCPVLVPTVVPETDSPTQPH